MKIPTFKLERFFAKYEFKVDYLLCSSDCESMTIQDLLAFEEGADEQFRKHWLGYTESQGSPSLRHEISRLYGAIDLDQILVHSGAEEAIFLFMQSVLQPEDHIIVHWPCYQSLVEIARSMGCQVTQWRAREENNWELGVDELRQSIQPNTKVIVINTPHNPTGYLMSKETFKEVNRLAQDNGIILFSDEVYREMEYAPEDRLPGACDLGDHTVSLGVMSKTYGLAGLRIGWVATQHTDIYSKMANLKDYTTICNSAPSEYLAELALRNRQTIVKRNLEIITKNLLVLDEFFERYADFFKWQRPKAGPIAFPRLIGEEIEAFCDNLVKRAGVLLLPGTLYDDMGNHFRIGFGRKDLPDAISRLEEFILKLFV